MQDLTGDVRKGSRNKTVSTSAADLAGTPERRQPIAEVVVAFLRVRDGNDPDTHKRRTR